MSPLPYSSSIVAALAVFGCASPAQPDERGMTQSVTPLWQASVGSPGLAVAAITSTTVLVGRVNGGGTDGALIGLDATSGAQRWMLPVAFLLPPFGVVALSDSLATVVTGGAFVIFDPRDGRMIRAWTGPRPDLAPSQALPQVLSDGRVLYASRARHLLALNTRTGRLDTLIRLPGDSARHPYIASLTVVNDTIYAPVASDALRGAAFRNTVPYRFDLRTGVLDSLRSDPSDSASLTRWMFPVSDLLVSATNYSEPSWLAFDRATGDRRWKVAAAPGSLGPYGQAALVGDTLFAGGNDGKAYIIHVPTGRLIRTQPILNGLATAAVACGRDVIFNVIGELTYLSRDGLTRKRVSGLPEGKNSFGGSFASGAGIAVIGNSSGLWMALPCAPVS